MEREEKMSTTRMQKNIEQNSTQLEQITVFFDKQLERTNYWLSFAEAKNGALLAINVAIMAVLVSVFELAPVCCATAIICFVISCGVCLKSFFPKVDSRPKKEKNKKEEEKEPNLLFYGDIAKIISTERYIELSIMRYFPEYKNVECDKTIDDLASEILINSRIAMQKYNVFKCAAIIDFFALIMTILFFVVA